MSIERYQIGQIINGLQAPDNYVIVPTSWVDLDQNNKFSTKYMP